MIQRITIDLKPLPYHGGPNDREMIIRAEVDGVAHATSMVVYIDDDLDSKFDYYTKRLLYELKMVIQDYKNNQNNPKSTKK